MSEQQPAEKVGYVDALIFGKSIRFELVRDPRTFGIIERNCGPFFDLWRRFKGGQHSSSDVRVILATAHPYVEPAQDPALRHTARLLAAFRDDPEPASPINGAPVHMVDTLMQRIPFGGWEELAVLIMAACIAGLDPAEAVFIYPPPPKALQAAAE